jgi:hypothetical protein
MRVLRLPHLSTFKLFSRKECRAPLAEIFNEALRGCPVPLELGVRADTKKDAGR